VPIALVCTAAGTGALLAAVALVAGMAGFWLAGRLRPTAADRRMMMATEPAGGTAVAGATTEQLHAEDPRIDRALDALPLGVVVTDADGFVVYQNQFAHQFDRARHGDALVRAGIDQVVTVGYSMGGPISLLVADRHPGLVAGLVVQATAMEWRATRLDRIQWRGLPVLGWLLRSRWLPYLLHRSFARLQRDFPAVEPWLEWLVGETRRNDPHAILEAARSLSHFDAGPWAGQLGLPAGMLITTKDRLVKPRQQRPLAAALGARIEELAADHLCTMTNPAEYSAATRRLVDDVVSRSLSQPLVEVLDLEVGSTPNGPAAH